MIRRLLLTALPALLLPSTASADYLRVQRPSIIRSAARGDGDELRRATRGEELALASPSQRSGYYRVLLGDGQRGWIYRTFVRRFAGSLPTSASDGGEPAAGEESVGPGALDATAFRPTDCPPEGRTAIARIAALNRLKNRAVGPDPTDLRGVPIEDFLFTEPDEERWQTAQAVEVVAYVEDVKPGDKETCNCGASGSENTDTHIELVRVPEEGEPTDRFVVEVTPTWRRFMASRGVDWSTATLRTSIEGKWVKVGGWLFLDREHLHNAFNTNPDGTKLWRRTAWEIHPITSLEVVQAPVQ